MRRNPGPVVCGAVVALIVIAISGSIRAQEMKDRELRPEFDFTTIQMPVEIRSIKLNGKDIQPGEKIKGDDNWLQGLSFTLKNISDKPIAYVAVTLLFRRPERVVGFVLSYGVDYSRGGTQTSFLAAGDSARRNRQPGAHQREIRELSGDHGFGRHVAQRRRRPVFN